MEDGMAVGEMEMVTTEMETEMMEAMEIMALMAMVAVIRAMDRTMAILKDNMEADKTATIMSTTIITITTTTTILTRVIGGLIIAMSSALGQMGTPRRRYPRYP